MTRRAQLSRTVIDTTLTIGALGERTGVTSETIRYYERVGVMPVPTRGAAGATHAGYRRYGSRDVDRLAFVRRARALGFSLDEVRDLLSLADDPSRPCAEVDVLARAHLDQVVAKLAQLAALETELRRVIGECRGGTAVADCRILHALGDQMKSLILSPRSEAVAVDELAAGTFGRHPATLTL